MTTETNAERLNRIKENWRFRDVDDNWVIEQARQTIDAQIKFVELHRIG